MCGTESFAIRRDGGGRDTGVQCLGERVVVQPDQPARGLRLQVFHAHLQRRADAGEGRIGEARSAPGRAGAINAVVRRMAISRRLTPFTPSEVT
jgi:hypothetical protein